MFFLFNPFDAHGLRRFLDNLERSLRLHPRVIWIVYDYPVRRAVLDDHSDFFEIATVAFASIAPNSSMHHRRWPPRRPEKHAPLPRSGNLPSRLVE